LIRIVAGRKLKKISLIRCLQGFINAINQEFFAKRGFNSQLIAPFILRMVGMALDPDEGNVVLFINLQKTNPKIGILFILKVL
jgi:hypothetical protein